MPRIVRRRLEARVNSDGVLDFMRVLWVLDAGRNWTQHLEIRLIGQKAASEYGERDCEAILLGVPNPQDRRNWRLELTEAGSKTAAVEV